MTTKLINNYLNTYKTPIANRNQPTYGHNINTQTEELDTRAYIKPLTGKGKLVKNNIFDIPGVMVKDTIYDIKALKHAINGSANDHELGKINDMGMKLGGLAIAAYLFTRKQTPLTKAMEFIGLASFFASMAIWPKIAIQLPTKLIHGVNSQQKYIDSFGRKKPFDLDPQFLPWDAFEDDEIQKKGDRLGIPKDIPNRRDLIQEKYKKIGIQNNTLWMMTAGFATPIMSALICNKAEKPIDKYLTKLRTKQAHKLMNNFPESVEKAKSNKIKNNINRIIELNKEQIIDNQLFHEIVDAYSEGMDLVTKKGLEADLRNLLFDNKYEVNRSTIENVYKNIETKFAKTEYEPLISELLPKQNEVIKNLKNKNLLDNAHDASGINKVRKEILLSIRSKVNEYNRANPGNSINWEEFITHLQNKVGTEDSVVTKALKSNPSSKLTPKIQGKLKKLANVMTEFDGINSVIRKFISLKVANGPSELAHKWNDIADNLIDIFEFTPKEIEKTRHDRELVNKLLREKIETIALLDEPKYKEFMDKLIKKVSEITKVMPDELHNDTLNKLNSSIDDNIIPKLRDKDLNMKNLIKKLVGVDYMKRENGSLIPSTEIRGSYKLIVKQFISERLLGTESSLLRLINGIDRYRAVATGMHVDQLYHDHPIEVKEELIEAMKKSILQDHSSDHATKGYMRRNPHPNPLKGDLVREESAGTSVKKVIYQFFGKTPPEKMVDIPSDAGFFQEKMKLIFNNANTETTENLLGAYGLKEKMQSWKNNSMSALADQLYFAKKNHTVYGGSSQSTSIFRFLITGIAPDEFMFNIFNQKYNTNKWFKMFGGMGAALLAVTVGAQFFFGKLKMPESTKG